LSQDYRHLINGYVRPHVGDLRLQAVHQARITRLYGDLVTSDGRNGSGLSLRTGEYVHAVLRKAFRDTVVVDQILPSNPVERAKRPRKTPSEPGKVWMPGQFRAFLNFSKRHRLFAFYRLAAWIGARRGELLNLRWRDVDLDVGEIRITGSGR
jgi:integrase